MHKYVNNSVGFVLKDKKKCGHEIRRKVHAH